VDDLDNIAIAAAKPLQPAGSPWLTDFAQTAMLALAYLLAASLGLASLGEASPSIPLIWPPAALALLAFLRRGWRALPGLLLGVAGLALLMQASPASITPATPWAGRWVLELLGPALAACLLRRQGFSGSLARPRDLLAFAAYGLLLAPALTGLINTLLEAGPASQTGLTPGAAWGLHSAAQAFSILCLAPTLLLLNRPRRAPLVTPIPSLHWADWPVQVLLLLGFLASASQFLFKPLSAASALSGWIFLPHLLLTLICLGRARKLPVFAALVFSILCLLASVREIQGGGVDGSSPSLLWAYLGSLTALPLLAGALKGQMRDRRLDWERVLDQAELAQAQWRLNAQGARLLSASSLWRQQLGSLTRSQAPLGQWLEAAHPLDRERVQQALQNLLPAAGKDSCCEPLRLLVKGKEWRHFELRALVLERHVQEGKRTGRAALLQCTLADVSWRHTAEERQRMSVSLFQHIHEGLLITDLDNLVLDVNPSLCEMLGAPREALIGQAALMLSPATLRRSGLDPAHMSAALAGPGYWQCRVHTERADGTPCQFQLTVSTIPEPDGPLRYRVVTVSDLTTTLLQQELLERQSRFDALTLLPNQEEFMRRLHAGLQQADREGFRLSICRVDLDQFKRINNQRGSVNADALLKQVALRLKNSLRSAPQWSDTVARLSGDEFALLLRSSSHEETQLALERMLKVLATPYRLEPSTAGAEPLVMSITASIGATVFPQDNSDAETLMRHAGHALYRVKHSGRNAFQLFDTAKRLRDEASLIALARVQQALDAGELQLFYQPKIDMQSAQVLGMEALLRWQHPDRGLLSPLHFLPLIESTGLAVQVGDWVIEQALKQCAQWQMDGLALQVSVNVTARQLQMPDFSQRLLELIRRHPEPVARQLCLEVLESAALADVDATHTLIQRCRTYGVSFALDDFGTGYSTLTYLKRLPVDALKIDRSFVQNMLIDPQDSALVEGVIGLARTFGCSVVAEGVESVAHARALLGMGCKLGQGNGIAPAMPAAEVPAWIQGFAESAWRDQIDSPAAGLL